MDIDHFKVNKLSCSCFSFDDNLMTVAVQDLDMNCHNVMKHFVIDILTHNVMKHFVIDILFTSILKRFNVLCFYNLHTASYRKEKLYEFN